jgi:tetratricopeptide (TPR) repeat protein
MLLDFKIFKIKRGDTEVTVEGRPPGGEPKIAPEGIIEGAQAPEKAEEPQEPTGSEPEEPFLKMHRAFVDRNTKDAEEYFRRMQESETDTTKKLSNECYYEFMRYRYLGNASALLRLEELTKISGVKEDALFWTAQCHEASCNYEKAIEIYRSLLALDLNDNERSKHIVSLSKCLTTVGRKDESLKELSGGFSRVSDSAAKARLYGGIADVHEVDGNGILKAIALQKVLQLSPERVNALFPAAYALSHEEISPLAAMNYDTLVRFDKKNSSALNNLGVEYDRLGLPIASVSYFKKASERKETLAMANLAFRYIGQGFEDEANDIIIQAKSEKNPHKNVGTAMASITESKEKEEKEWESIKSIGVKQQQFLWEYAEAIFEPGKLRVSFDGQWIAPNGKVFLLSQKDQTLQGIWESENDGEKFDGNVQNRAAQIKFSKKGAGLGLLIAQNWGSPEDGLIFLTQDGKEIQVQLGSKKDFRFLRLKRNTIPERQEAGKP